MMKLEDMDYDEFLDWAAGNIMKGLLAGKFRSEVGLTFIGYERWLVVQKTKAAAAAKKKVRKKFNT